LRTYINTTGMEDRIEINGEWYVKETTLQNDEPIIDVTFTNGCVFENNEYCFEVTQILRDDMTPYPDISITFTDKRNRNRDHWTEEHWDNNNWMLEVLEDDKEALVLLIESNIDVDIVKQVFKKLVQIKWLGL